VQSAFTLVEMVVVVAIVVVLIGLILPAASTMWNERKLADAENTIKGLLMTTRANAVGGSEGQHGILFYLDDEGVQHVAAIAQAPIEPADLDTDGDIDGSDLDILRLCYLDVFRVQPGRNWAIPAPLRVTPSYIAQPDASGSTDNVSVFSDEEVANDNFDSPEAISGRPPDQAQRHRNFFTMVFSTEGQLMVRRDVLIQDPDLEKPAPANLPRGDLTGLAVGIDHSTDPPKATVTRFYDKTTNMPRRIDPTGGPYTVAIPHLVVGESSMDVGLNFPSVDGLLLYDDSLFKELTEPGEKRDYLLTKGLPLYVNRLTGSLVRGPVGEDVASVLP